MSTSILHNLTFMNISYGLVVVDHWWSLNDRFSRLSRRPLTFADRQKLAQTVSKRVIWYNRLK